MYNCCKFKITVGPNKTKKRDLFSVHCLELKCALKIGSWLKL